MAGAPDSRRTAISLEGKAPLVNPDTAGFPAYNDVETILVMLPRVRHTKRGRVRLRRPLADHPSPDEMVSGILLAHLLIFLRSRAWYYPSAGPIPGKPWFFCVSGLGTRRR